MVRAPALAALSGSKSPRWSQLKPWPAGQNVDLRPRLRRADRVHVLGRDDRVVLAEMPSAPGSAAPRSRNWAIWPP